MTKLTGKILWIDHRDGNGIIVDNLNNEIYFDSSVTNELKSLKRNDQVTFYENYLEAEGLTCATDVKKGL